MRKAVAIKPKTTTKKTKFDKKTYLDWYEKMYLMRKFEEKCGMLYTMQKFGGFCHLYIGQEAVAMGIVEAIGKGDKVITAYRDHAFPLAMGTSADQCMAELYGKTTGTSKGKGGSMHFFDVEKGFWGGHGIVGGQIGLGAGIAFSEKYKGTINLVSCLMGDGAVARGMLDETCKVVRLWKLPVVFLVENNNYAMGTSVERTSNVLKLEKIGASYEMPSRTVDGMSVEAVFHAIDEAAERARKGDGPTWLDVKTYRYKGHSMSDPQKYRTKEEVEKYKGIDPVQQVLSVIKNKKYATEKQIKDIEAKVKKIIEESVKFAEDSPVPEPSALYEDVYMQEDYPYIVE